MPIFFIPAENFTAHEVLITGSDVRHITKVLRLNRGDRIKVCDRQGRIYLARIEVVDKSKIVAALERELLPSISPETPASKPPLIVIGQAITKRDTMELIIQKASELGASEIYPLLTKRTQVHFSSKKVLSKIDRWQRIAYEAAKQSGRRNVLQVGNVMELGDFCQAKVGAELKLIFWEDEKRRYLRDVLPKGGKIGTAVLIIGPEGGFTSTEIALAQQYDFLSTGLGPRILRVETVALTLLAILQYLYGDLG
jgi:16S rRNA (uracil1498-N3)-methyltransferase